MSKEAIFHKTVGNSMAASIGAFGNLGPSAMAAPTVPDEQAGRSRHRDVGYMLMENIVPDPDQVRKEFSQSAIQNLADSIKKHGLLMPIEVTWNAKLGKHVIMHGERRFRASRLAGMDSIACIFRTGELTESERLQRQLTENCLREDLQPLEQAKAFDALKKLNEWNDLQLAEALCLSPSLITKRMALLRLPEEIQDKVESGVLSGAAAYEVSRLPDVETQLETVEQIIAEDLSRDDVTQLVRSKKSPKSRDKGGKPLAKSKTFKTSRGVCTIKLSRKKVTFDDYLAIVDEVRAMLLEKQQSTAA